MEPAGTNQDFIGFHASPVLMTDRVQKKSVQVLTPSKSRTPLGDITNNFLCREINSELSVGIDRERAGKMLVMDV